MKPIFFASICFFTFYSYTNSNSVIKEKLSPFKELLINHTYAHHTWPSKKPKSRYYTLKKSFELFEKINGNIIVELGTTRSFMHGGLIGCNSDDASYWHPEEPADWDWGAGCFTLMTSICLEHLNAYIHTVDIEKKHIERCKIITNPFSKNISYHVSSSENFLRNFNEKIDFLYIDTGDMTPIEKTAQLQLREAKIIIEKNLINDNGIILIDDVKNPTPKIYGETSDYGKAKYSLPYFLNHGFIIIENEYQVLLQKKRN